VGEEVLSKFIDELISEKNSEPVLFVIFIEVCPLPFGEGWHLSLLDGFEVVVEFVKEVRAIVILESVDIDPRKVEGGDSDIQLTATEVSHMLMLYTQS
jgi:hypothetical protein